MKRQTKVVTEKRWGWLDIVGNLGLMGSHHTKADLMDYIGTSDTPVRVTLTYPLPKEAK